MSTRRRVGHVINTIGLGGVPEAAWQLLARLPRQEFERSLFVLSQPEGETEARRQRLQRFVDAGVAVELAPPGASRAERLGALGQWLQRQRLELLHTHSYKPNLVARPVAVEQGPGGPRIVAHYHNQYDNKWAKDDSLALDARLADVSAALVACSASVAQHVQQRLGLPPGRVEVVPNGVDTQRFQPMDRAAARRRLGLVREEADLQRPMVGIVGRLCRQKGQDLFLRAAAQLSPRWPQVRWLMVGSADDPAVQSQLGNLAASLGFSAPRLQWLGHVQDMPAVYGALDLLVAPSRWEGFGLMLVEAMACGTPIVATRAGAIPEVLGESPCGRLVATEDVGALAAAITEVLSRGELRIAMAAAGPRRAADFSWDASAAGLARLYERLLAGAARGAPQ
jgi:glycosyltransferase involved in cell wall biosynthesis